MLKISSEFINVDGAHVAIRKLGSGAPLVLLNRFRGTMDNWDPALLNAFARERQVIIFDSLGIGETSGQTPTRVERWADFAASVIRTQNLDATDLLG